MICRWPLFLTHPAQDTFTHPVSWNPCDAAATIEKGFQFSSWFRNPPISLPLCNPTKTLLLRGNSVTGGTPALSGTGSINGSSGIEINGSGAKCLQIGSVAGTRRLR
jgi:hypothetical protein